MLTFVMFCTAGMAQNTMTYSMTPIVISGKSGMAIGAAESVVFDGKGKCLSVVTGIRTLEVASNNKGTFGSSCVETAPVATVLMELTSLIVYPNPTHNISILKCDGQFDVNLSCQVRVMSMDGRPMMSQMVSMKAIKAGYQIDASAYAAGTYVITVDFMTQHYTLKLIKL